ncbi:DUF5709 domain-containing protein [Nonomuraea sp. NPDC005983]|uniref:DUF5709 domain-containing protein n=1 Tax=Nonomuraea sp. NPDC005983 TaxID=3155595 RepID=UPI0033AC1412
MTEQPPDRYGYSDEQGIEVEEWNDDLGLRHEITENDPGHAYTLDERLRWEKPERAHAPRTGHRITQPDEGLASDTEKDEVGQDWGEDGGDFSAEERAVRVDRDEDLS